MIHSSAIVRHGKSAIFLAPGGGGKTTIVRSSDSGTILSDDQNILRQEMDQIIVYSTPWGRIINGSFQAPLGGIFMIEKAEKFEITEINPREVIQFIWGNNIPFWTHLLKERKIKALDIIINICHHSPVYRLRFPPGYINWDAIDAVIIK